MTIEEYAAVVGPPADDPRMPAEGTPQFGGELHVATHDEPATLDAHLSTRSNVVELNAIIAEGLYAFDASGSPVPALAEDTSWNDEQTEATITLRQGVLFHDGSPLTSADVVASLNRWAAGPLGASVQELVSSIEASDDYTVVIRLTESFPFLTTLLTVPQNAGAYIYSEEQVAEVGEDDIGTPIGTGPYRVEEWRENQYLRLSRFDDYVGRAEPASGFAGGKVAYLDDIYFDFVADESVRIAGLQSGQYHVAIDINADQFERFENDASIRARVVESSWPCVNFNKKQGPMTDVRIRQAFNAAIDVTVIAAAMGSSDFYPTSPSLMPSTSIWASDAGEEVYLEYDPDKARALLEEAGYDGQSIRWLVNPDSGESYTPALVAKPMLEEVGFVIELVTLDAATLSSDRGDPNKMEAFGCGYTARQDPTLMAPWNSGHPGWWDTEEKNQLIEQLRSESDVDARVELWNDFQTLFWEQLPLIKFADLNALFLESSSYSGLWYETNNYYYVNTWLNE